MPSIELGARDLRIAGIEFRAQGPTDITGVEAYLFQVHRGRQAHRGSEEILNVLLKRPRTEKPALLRIILQRKIIIVGGPRVPRRVGGPRAPRRVGHGNGAAHNGRILHLLFGQIPFADGGVGNDVGKIGSSVRLRAGESRLLGNWLCGGEGLFGFEREEADLHLPRCEMTGVTSDIHLVVYGEGTGIVAKLLGPEPRFVLQKVTQLSVPVTVISLASVGQLETAQKLPLNSAAAATLRDWFSQDLEGAWAKLQKENERQQGVLSLGPDGGELPLEEK